MFGTIFGQWEFLKYRANCWSFGPAKTVVLLMLLLVVSGTGPPGYFEDWLFCIRSDVASKRLVSLVTKLIIFRQYHQTRVIKWVQQPFLIISMTHHNLWCQCKRPCWFLYNSTQFQSVNIGVTSQRNITTWYCDKCKRCFVLVQMYQISSLKVEYFIAASNAMTTSQANSWHHRGMQTHVTQSRIYRST